MKESKLVKSLRAIFVAALVPFITACNGGGGGSLLGAGSLFSGLAAGDDGSGGGVLPGITGDEVGTLTNPEPASMLLVGSGMAVMAYYNNKKNKDVVN